MEEINQCDKEASLDGSYRGLLQCHAKCTELSLIGELRERDEAERHMMDASLAASLERVVTLKQMLAFPALALYSSWDDEETITSEQ